MTFPVAKRQTPDLVPVPGSLDDAGLVPLGIALAVRLIPSTLMHEFREEITRNDERFISRIAATSVVMSWIVRLVVRQLGPRQSLN